MSDDIVMEDVYAKLAKAREKKAAAKQEQVAAHKLKSNARDRKSYNKKKKSEAAKALKKAPSNGDDEALNNCPHPKKKKYAGMMTVEKNLQSYLYVRAMKKIPI